MKRTLTCRTLPCAALILSVLGCASTPGHHPLTMATLYTQTAAESAAASRSVYAAARVQLDAALADRSWSAALEQEGDYEGKPPAIVLDVDETVLDNSPYEARLIEDGASYPAGWDAWCDQGAAEPVPGALEFTQYAAERGVTVFYVTNRKAHLEDGTHRNLVREGFPVTEGLDVLLMADERSEWTSDKTSRRRHLAETHRIVMLFGDNMGDFVARDDARGTPAEREAVMARHGERWGTRWFMVPNAMYGYWDGAVLDYDYDRREEELDGLRLDALDREALSRYASREFDPSHRDRTETWSRITTLRAGVRGWGAAIARFARPLEPRPCSSTSPWRPLSSPSLPLQLRSRSPTSLLPMSAPSPLR